MGVMWRCIGPPERSLIQYFPVLAIQIIGNFNQEVPIHGPECLGHVVSRFLGISHQIFFSQKASPAVNIIKLLEKLVKH